MTYATVIDYVGVPPIGNWGGYDATPKLPLGTIVQASDPYWGSGEFIYLQAPVSQAAKVGAVMAYDFATAFLASLVANTALLGKALAVAVNVLPSLATPQYGWFMVSGYGPIWSNASIAANNPIGIVAAGQGGALAAGKAFLATRVTLPATGSNITKNIGTTTGSAIIQLPNSDGLFAGMLVTGTGVGALAVINSIAVDGKSAVLSVVSTASNTVVGTFAYATATDFYNLCTFSRIAAQGPIT